MGKSGVIMPVDLSIKWHRYCIKIIIFSIMFFLIVPNFLTIQSETISKSPPQTMLKINYPPANQQKIDLSSISIASPESLSRPAAPDWPMFGKDSSHSHRSVAVSKGIYQVSLKWDKWSQITGNGIDSRACTIGNFTNNVNWQSGFRNVKHVVYADNGNISIVDGESGSFIWQLDVDLIDKLNDNDLVYTTPTLGYFDSDSDLDLIFGTTDGTLYCYEPTTNYDKSMGYSWSTDNVNQDKLWSLPLGSTFTRASSVLGLLDSDSYPDLIIGGGNKLFAVSGNKGTELWHQTLPGSFISTPALYKDGSDINTVVTVLNQTNLNYSASFFNAKSSTGNRLAVKYFSLGPFPIPNMIPSPTVGELDGNTNNDNELVICTPFEGLLGNGRMYVYHANRTLFWSTPLNQITGQLEATPAIADLDGDGFNEIIIVSWKLGTIGPMTHIYAYHGNNGTQAWHIIVDTIGMPPIYTNERAVGSPIIADVNTDDNLDVIFETSPNLYAIDGISATELWSTSFTGTGRELWSTPAAADIDNDGFLDIVAEGAAVSHVIIDLTMNENDFSLSTENVTENQQVTIKAVVHNTGSANAEDIKLSFFENNKLLGNSTSGLIPGGDSRELRLDWTPKEEGKRSIKIKIDPNNDIEEINEKNNEFEKEVNVIPSFPDFIVESVEYYRGDGAIVDNKNKHLIEGEECTIKSYIKNIGGDEGKDIIVQLFDWGSKIGNDLELSILEIQEIKNVSVAWKPIKGNHEIKIKIDPKNMIPEVNESNNEYLKEIIVKSKIPDNYGYICKGWVFQPNNSAPAPAVKVEFKNNRTKSVKSVITNSTGYYKFDLQNLENKYQEGDEIIIFATDGANESRSSFRIYSEDKTRLENITLKKLPTYAIGLKSDSTAKTVYPNKSVIYNITIINRGNEYNTVELLMSDLKTRTGEPVNGWNAYLNDYIIEDIPPTSSQPGIILTIVAPAKNDQARALDQVVLAITAKSNYDPEQTAIIGFTTTVGRVYDFILTVKKPKYELEPLLNQTAKFDVMVKNNGNDDDTVNITLTGPVNWTAQYIPNLDLKLGEEKSVEILITGDESMEAGEHRFTLSVESIDKKGLSTTGLTIEVIRPDLRFYQDITYYPKEPNLSEQVSFEAYIYNDGNSAIQSFFVEFKVQGPEDDYDIKPVINLSSKKFEILIFNWTPTRPGQYIVEFTIDPYNEIIEGDTKNNYYKLEFNFTKDIAIINEPVFSNNNPKEDEKIKISVTVKNLGNVDITTPFEVYFYRGDPSDEGIIIASQLVREEITAKSDIVVTVTWKVKGSGEQTIFVVANPNKNFTETDYTNNMISKSIYISKNPGTEELTDYSAWIILLIFIIGILIIIFLVLSPDKHPKRKKGSRRVGEKTKRDSTKELLAKAGKKEVKFIELSEEDIVTDESEEEFEEVESIDEEKDISKHKSKKGRSKRGGFGIFGSLFTKFGGKGKKRSIAEPTTSPTQAKIDKLKRTEKTSDTDDSEEDIAMVEVVGEGALEEEDEDEEEVEGYEEEEEKVRELKEKPKSRGKGKSESDLGWEYQQMIGIR